MVKEGKSKGKAEGLKKAATTTKGKEKGKNKAVDQSPPPKKKQAALSSLHKNLIYTVPKDHFRDGWHRLRYGSLDDFKLLETTTLDWNSLPKNPGYDSIYKKLDKGQADIEGYVCLHLWRRSCCYNKNDSCHQHQHKSDEEIKPAISAEHNKTDEVPKSLAEISQTDASKASSGTNPEIADMYLAETEEVLTGLEPLATTPTFPKDKEKAKASSNEVPSKLASPILKPKKKVTKKASTAIVEEPAHATVCDVASEQIEHPPPTLKKRSRTKHPNVEDHTEAIPTAASKAAKKVGVFHSFPKKRAQENNENSVDRQHKRMMKNRESAARSRAEK
ncbi:hypothetical protein COLO4_38055 [Corchorus olitorius]|uniref:BZIP domain-containing protein n=1 Tax=Corchorus olitorius TaxID=93759 RepID=A0A1R3FXB6_9ROSI|nr:hypothetical protein COLO4_38055 [Corchorus olitorius]